MNFPCKKILNPWIAWIHESVIGYALCSKYLVFSVKVFWGVVISG